MCLVLHLGIEKAVSIRDRTSQQLKKEKNNISCLLNIRNAHFFCPRRIMDLDVFLGFFYLFILLLCSLFMSCILKVSTFIQTAIDPITWSKRALVVIFLVSSMSLLYHVHNMMQWESLVRKLAVSVSHSFMCFFPPIF